MKRTREALPRAVILLVTLLVMASCSSTITSLKKAKEYWKVNDFGRLADMKVDCKASDEGCNQLHLLKGDACYRLAKAGKSPLKYYECSAVHLDTGIRQTKKWQMEGLDLNRAQVYENLCESLRELQFMKKGEESEEFTRRLLLTSKEFLALEPGNPAATYFLNIAKLVELSDCLNHPAACPRLCRQIEEMISDIEGVLPASRDTRYEKNLSHLYKQVRTEQDLAGCR